MDYPRTHSYTCDASGNITGDGVREYVWDSTGRLTEVKISSSTVGAYTYNAYNQRTKKVAGTTTHYVYGAGGLLYGEYDNAGDLIREYVYLNGAPLAQVNAGSPETLTYLHPDHLGTPKFGTNAGGTQVWSWAPDAFGNGAPSGSVTVNLRMPGQYFDAESGLFYNWNRYYNPAIGRYISSDPIGLEGGINTFLYAAANPVMAIDPEGLFVILLAGPSAAAAVADLAIIGGVGWGISRGIQQSQITGANPQDMAVAACGLLMGVSCNNIANMTAIPSPIQPTDPIAATTPGEGRVCTMDEGENGAIINEMSKGRGERGATGGSSGTRTDNPYKHCRETGPNTIECRDHQTGKWIPKKKPADWDKYKK